MASDSGSPQAIISPTMASRLAKEIATGKSFKGGHDLTAEAISEKKQRIASYNLGKRANLGKLQKQLNGIAADTKDIKKDTTEILEDTKAIRDALKEIRLLKRPLDNEVGDIKERESKRLHTEKHGLLQGLEEAIDNLGGESVQDKRDNLKAQYNAALKALNAEERAAKSKAKAESKAKAKAESKAKAKAKAKATASSRCPEAEAQDVSTKARPAPVEGWPLLSLPWSRDGLYYIY